MLDVSGSMDEIDAGNQTRLQAAKVAIVELISALGYTDYIGLVSFSSTAT